uniref:AlNc14C215G8986 protein n=1 Tax=Albugo laibachii Nc14 TaxID=890382 RepID=F0WRI6_9STRA|nr:AlNc14C215G8986 [Albugo laibachii Nc14]|eukprot:CCA23949.1 AlNc14C215G8986 [Albugo laibachii Nc14]
MVWIIRLPCLNVLIRICVKNVRRRGIEPRPHPWKGRILTIRPTALLDRMEAIHLLNQYKYLNSTHLWYVLSYYTKYYKKPPEYVVTSDHNQSNRTHTLSLSKPHPPHPIKRYPNATGNSSSPPHPKIAYRATQSPIRVQIPF